MGLDPYFGFMHKSHTGFQPLVYDLIEPFRWLVDYTTFQMANYKDFKSRIKLKNLLRRDGVNGFLKKPIELDELIKAITS